MEIDGKGYCETHNYGQSHILAEVVNDGREAVDARDMECRIGDQVCVKGGESVTLVLERLVVEGRDGDTLLPIVRHEDGEDELEDHQAAVSSEGELRGEGVLVNVLTELDEEWADLSTLVR